MTVFLDLLGFGLVIPILPLYSETMHASDVETGALLASYSVMQLFFSPIWGRFSDRYGRRPVLLISILGSCLSQLGYALAPSFGFLVAARALAGVCGANITAAQAYIADVTTEENRAAGMGMIGAAFGMGFVFGPALGGLLSHHSARAPFFLAAALAAINFALAVALLREPRSPGQRSRARTLTVAGLRAAFTSGPLTALVVLYFIITFGFANLEGTFSFYLERRFGFGRREASYLFAFLGVILVLVQGGLVRRVAPRFGERRLVIAGTLLMAAGLSLQALAHGLPLLLFGLGLTAAGNGINSPSLSALISRAAGDDQGSLLGVSQAASALGRVLGPLAGTATLVLGEGAPCWTAALFLFASSLFAAVVVRQPARPAPSQNIQ